MNQAPVFVQMALHAWNTQTGNTERLLFSLSDEQLHKEFAPGKNTGIYIVGHLIAIHDAMNEILGLGTRDHADLDFAFVQMPDKIGNAMPSIAELKQYWTDVHQKLNQALAQADPDELMKKHNRMSDEDFAKDPSRNKLSVLLNRTNHCAYHLGQLILLK